jgi:hypothetical protein
MMQWLRHVSGIGEIRNAHGILVGNLGQNKPSKSLRINGKMVL